MGAGKTTVGRRVAHRLRFRFIDTDRYIEEKVGLTVPEIFARYGEPEFRRLEAEVVQELATMNKVVIATGGGMGANPDHIASLKQHALVICLWATPEVLYRRLRRSKNRPLLQVPDPLSRIRELLQQRMPVYRQADVLMNTGLRSLTELVRQVLYHFRLAQQDTPTQELHRQIRS